MASVHKHSSGRSPYWFAAYIGADGQRKLRSTKKKKYAEAIEVALEYERAAKAARGGTLTVAQCRKVLSEMLEKSTGDSVEHKTVEGFFKDWLENKETTKSERTAERYETVLNKFKAHLGVKARLSIATVTTRDVQSFLNARSKAGSAPKTVSVDRKSLSSVFGSAFKQGVILLNPVLATEIAKAESSKRGTFTPTQVALLVKHATSDEWKTAIMLGYFTAARLRDCVTMELDNLDFQNRTIKYKQGKTGAEVVVPMHSELETYLLKLISTDKPMTILCPSLAEKDSGGAHGLSALFAGIMKAAGIDRGAGEGKGNRTFNKLSFHSLRHSFNSALANAGVSQERRMKLTGHTSAEVNTGYTHHEVETLREEMNKLPGLKP